MSQKAPKTSKQWAKTRFFQDALERHPEALGCLISACLLDRRAEHKRDHAIKIEGPFDELYATRGMPVDIVFDKLLPLGAYMDVAVRIGGANSIAERMQRQNPDALIHAALSLGYITEAANCARALRETYAKCPRLEK